MKNHPGWSYFFSLMGRVGQSGNPAEMFRNLDPGYDYRPAYRPPIKLDRDERDPLTLRDFAAFSEIKFRPPPQMPKRKPMKDGSTPFVWMRNYS